MIYVRKKEGETTGSLMYRFSKKLRQSGVLREVKKRRFHKRPLNRGKRRASAIFREDQKKEYKKARKMGLV